MCFGSKTINNTTTSEGTSSADLPEWAKPYFERNIAKAEAEFSKPYQAYSGNRLAGVNPNLATSRTMLGNVVGGGIPGLSAAQNYTTAGMQTANQLGQYGPGQYSEFSYSQPQTFTGANVSQYMSPYQQNVTDVQKNRAVQDFNRMQGSRDAKAVQAGAFGGSRAAVQQGIADEGLVDRMAAIQATGDQNAFNAATKQFGADRTAMMTAEQRQADELGRVQTGTEASRQFGAGQGVAALQAGQGLAGDLTQYGELGRQTDIQDVQLLEGLGAAERAESQQGLDLGYQNYLEQQGFTREQIGNMTGILGGMPIAATGTTSYQGTQTTPMQQPSAFSQIAGAGLSGLSLYKAFQ